jgi:hypothetical protein
MSEVYSAGNLHGARRSNAEFDCIHRAFPWPVQGTLAADSCIIPNRLVDRLAFGMTQWVYTASQIKANTIGAAIARFQGPKFGLRPICFQQANTARSQAFCCSIGSLY